MMELVRFVRNFLKKCVCFTIITVESLKSAFFFSHPEVRKPSYSQVIAFERSKYDRPSQ